MIDSIEMIEGLINKSEMILVYFGGESCGVCVALKPKIEDLLKKYPKIKNVQVDVEKSLELSAAFNIFTIPGILIFVNGKETIREARYISVMDIEARISRYYNLMFE